MKLIGKKIYFLMAVVFIITAIIFYGYLQIFSKYNLSYNQKNNFISNNEIVIEKPNNNEAFNSLIHSQQEGLTIAESDNNIKTETVIIESGWHSNQIIEKLYEKNIIHSKLFAKVLVTYFYFQGKSLKAGEYAFFSPTSLFEVISKILSGKVHVRFVTIPECLSNKEVYEILNNIPELKGKINFYAPEGMLMPETYDFVYGQTRDALLQKMYSNQQKFLKEQNARQEFNYLKSYYDYIILASIIEKETAISAEKNKVSSVFHNRLRIGMPLQADPTIIYALSNGRTKLNRKVLASDLKVDSPYNTYFYKGLTPTAICNPGKEAIVSAFDPDSTNYLYFVVDGKGGHNFAASLKEHNKNMRRP